LGTAVLIKGTWYNTLTRTLRETYGPGFAPDCDLSECRHQIDEQSLPQLVHDRH